MSFCQFLPVYAGLNRRIAKTSFCQQKCQPWTFNAGTRIFGWFAAACVGATRRASCVYVWEIRGGVRSCASQWNTVPDCLAYLFSVFCSWFVCWFVCHFVGHLVCLLPVCLLAVRRRCERGVLCESDSRLASRLPDDDWRVAFVCLMAM